MAKVGGSRWRAEAGESWLVGVLPSAEMSGVSCSSPEYFLRMLGLSFMSL